jgi:hypothetical protein
MGHWSRPVIELQNEPWSENGAQQVSLSRGLRCLTGHPYAEKVAVRLHGLSSSWAELLKRQVNGAALETIQTD